MSRRGLSEPELSTVDCTGILTGNADLADSLAWSPSGQQQRTPLPVYPQPADLPPSPAGGAW